MEISKAIEKIYRSALNFLFPLNSTETYSLIIKEAAALAGAEYGSIFLAKNNLLVRVYTSIPSRERIEPLKRGYTYESYSKHRVLLLSEKDIREHHPEANSSLRKSTVLVPLVNQGKAIGVLSLQSKQHHHFNKNKVKALKLFAAMASLAIRKTQLYSEVKDSLEMRDLFISLAAHELKTPLTVIYGYSQIIQRRVMTNKNILPDMINTLTNEVTRLIYLVNELMQIEQIKTGKFQYRWKICSLSLIIQRAVKNFNISFPRHRLIVNSSLKRGEDLINVDFDKILQVINNLLNNSAKFSRIKNPITLSVVDEDNFIRIEVSDKGHGIHKKDLDKIFEGFYKGRNNTKEGMGLGLFIAKSIIDRHEGHIEIQSKMGQGTVVTIELPKITNARTRKTNKLRI